MGNILSVIVINIIQNINYQYQEYYYMNAGIYGIKNKNNNDLIYVGSSVNIDIRINQHLYNVKNEVNQEIYNKIIDIVTAPLTDDSYDDMEINETCKIFFNNDF